MRRVIESVLEKHIGHRIMVEPHQPHEIELDFLVDEIVAALEGRTTDKLSPQVLFKKMMDQGFPVSHAFLAECQHGRITTEREALDYFKRR